MRDGESFCGMQDVGCRMGCGKQGAGSMMGDQGCRTEAGEAGEAGDAQSQHSDRDRALSSDLAGSTGITPHPIPSHPTPVGPGQGHPVVFGGPWAVPGSVPLYPCPAQWEQSRRLTGLRGEIKHSCD